MFESKLDCMKNMHRLTVLFTLVMFFDGYSIYAQTNATDPLVQRKADDVRSLNAELWFDNLLHASGDNTESYELRIWRLYHVVEKNFYLDKAADRGWSLVKNDMTRRGLDFWENEDVDPKYCRCLLKKNVCKDQSNRLYDLFVDFLINAKTNQIWQVEVHLVCQINKPFSEVVNRNVFQENFPVERLLSVATVQTEALHYPQLISIDVSYRSYMYSRFDNERNGFAIKLELSDGKATKSITYGVISGLDADNLSGSQAKGDSSAHHSKDILVESDLMSGPKLTEVGRTGVFWVVGREGE